MERVTGTEPTIEVFENDIQLYLQQFKEEQNIEDYKTVPQSVWNACLTYIQRHVFTDKKVLKERNNVYTDNTITPTNCNSYNYDLLTEILNYYIYICNLYCKEVSLMGFSKLTGIDINTISLWGNNDNRLSTTSLGIYKKLMAENEECWVNNLFDGKKNPVSSYGTLKQRHRWESPFAADSNRQKQTLSAKELPKLGEVMQIAQNEEVQ